MRSTNTAMAPPLAEGGADIRGHRPAAPPLLAPARSGSACLDATQPPGQVAPAEPVVSVGTARPIRSVIPGIEASAGVSLFW